MVRHFDERIHERKQMFGGQGEAQFHRILNGPDEMYGKGRVFSHVVLEKGAEIGSLALLQGWWHACLAGKYSKKNIAQHIGSNNSRSNLHKKAS